jgi:hypothetical protein
MTIDDAIAYIRAKLRDWAQVPVRINAEIQRGSRLAVAARAAGDREREAKALAAMQRLGSLLQIERATTGKVRSLVQAVVGTDDALGFPVVLIPIALAVAAGMALVYKSLKNESDLLDAVERGTVPAEVLGPRPGIGETIATGAAKVILPVALGLGALWVGKRMLDRPARAR